MELMELWASGAFTGTFDIEMAVKNAGATGACSVYQFVQELDYLVIAEEDDAKQEWTGTEG